jgi:DNA-binding NtrC family response regulator
MQIPFQIAEWRPLDLFQNAFFLKSLSVFVVYPGFNPTATHGIAKAARLFASCSVLFAGFELFLARLSRLFAGWLWYLLAGWYRVGVQGAGQCGPEIALLWLALCSANRWILIGVEPKTLMSDFPWNQLWQLAHWREGSSASGPEVLRLLSKSVPVQSLSLLTLIDSKSQAVLGEPTRGKAPGSKRGSEASGVVYRVLYVHRNGTIDIETLDLPCSLSRWVELHDWVQTGSVLGQPSPKRSGKLAWLATEELTGSLLAIPLRPRERGVAGESLGVAVLELEHGRTLPDASIGLLEQFASPLSFYLQSILRSPGVASVASVPSTLPADTDKEPMVGSSEGLRKVMERVMLVSNSDMPVLIFGDTGTGKEVIARAIHARSARSSQPFLRVNCGAIPPELIDSQLFGHERGSFTGASDQRKGWFERADGGTLFLDEVGELPLAAQVRLLRVLQEHQIERVGGEKTIEVDVRIVAATHRDLAAMVHDRTFREDLWYRINLFPILLPRLCERLEDIPALTRHFARKAASKLGLPYAQPTASDIDRLLKYSWPGNIRELQAVVDRAVILGRGHHLDIATALGAGFTFATRPAETTEEPTFYEVIPESSYLQLLTPTQNTATPSVQPKEDLSILPLNEMIKQHIERALLRTQGQVEGKRGAARLLQVNPHTLRAKMRKLGIRWVDYRPED